MGKIIVSRLKNMNIDGELLSFYEKYIVGISAKLNRILADLMVREFMFIESIIIDHQLDIDSLRVSSPSVAVMPVIPEPRGATANFKIGIVDDGISKNRILKPFIKGISP